MENKRVRGNTESIRHPSQEHATFHLDDSTVANWPERLEDFT
jgi:hypothetical protein